jgi:hypothetical protein
MYRSQKKTILACRPCRSVAQIKIEMRMRVRSQICSDCSWSQSESIPPCPTGSRLFYCLSLARRVIWRQRQRQDALQEQPRRSVAGTGPILPSPGPLPTTLLHPSSERRD